MASVLETFLILFESNADDVDKGAKQAEGSTRKLNESLRETDKASQAVGDSFLQMLKTAGGALAAVVSVGAITSAVMAAADNADALGEFSDRLGLNIEEVNAWGDAVQVNGGTAEGFRSSIDSLIDGLVTFATKGTSRVAPFFKELGIEMIDAKGNARDVMEILPELADAFEGLTKQESAGLGRKLGLDQGTIMLLQRGRREVDAQIARQKELGTVTAEAAEIAGAFNDQYDDTAKVFRSLFTVVGSTILPLFTRVLNGLQGVGSFLSKHSDFIVGLLIALGAAVAFYVIPPFITMAAAVITAFAPFLLMGALVAGLALGFALLYDDIMNFIDGNDSLIGQIMSEYPAIGAMIQWLIDYFKTMWDAVSWIFNSILSLLQISAAGWGMLFGIIGDGLGSLTGLFSGFGDIVGGIWDFLGKKVSNFIELVRIVIGLVKGVAGGISGALDNVKASLGIGGLAEGKETLGAASGSSINTTTSNSIANSSRNKSSNVSTGPITINTQATDAEGIAGAVGNSLGQQIQQAATTFDDGVNA